MSDSKTLNYDQINSYTKYAKLVEEMRNQLKDLSKNDYAVPERQIIPLERDSSYFVSMPAYDKKLNVLINKVATVFPRKPGDNLDMISSYCLAFSAETGLPLGMLDGNALTEIKCAAITSVVTDICAIPNAKKIAIIGSGKQAHQQIKGIFHVRDIKEVNIVSRNQDNAKKFAEMIKKEYPAITVNVLKTIDEAIDEVDIIATTTSSPTPLNEFENIEPHVHMNIMGAHTTESREVSHDLLKKSFVVVEELDTAIREAGPVHQDAVDIKELICNKDFKSIQNGISIFSSTGHALLDAITAGHILSNI